MELSYLAGLIDGEGSISLLKHDAQRARRPVVAVGMTDPEPVAAAHAAYGGFVRTQDRPGRQTMHIWRIQGRAALELLDEVAPLFVIERRRKLAQLLTERYPRNRSHRLTLSEALFREGQKINAKRQPKLQALAPQPPSDADLAYVAGILDGEGYVDFDSRRIEVFSTDPELCAWLRSRCGGRTHSGRPARGKQRATWRWVCPPTRATWIAGVADRMLLPRKRDELRRLEDFRRSIPDPGWVRLHEGDEAYVAARQAGTLRAVAARENSIPLRRAEHLDTVWELR